MLALFFQSVRLHFRWWWSSLCPGRHQSAPLGVRRLLFLLVGYPAFLLLQGVHWLGFACDALCFPGYRKVKITAPVFVLGIPRSGTTFLHRTLAEDRKQFTSFTSWEAVLAPSITERKILGALRVLDRLPGSPLSKITEKLLRSAAGDFQSVHEVGPRAAEEDYLSLLPAGACFILLLAFPFAAELRLLGQLEELPDEKRERILNFYRKALQRHLYCHPGKRLISKNAAFSSWAGALREIFPDGKFLVCVREPTSALSSQLSALSAARSLFATDPDGHHTAHLFSRIYTHSFRVLAEFVDLAPPSQVAVIEQSDMRAEPAGTIRSALDQLGLACPGLTDNLNPGHTSAHRHHPADFPVDPGSIKDCMKPAYEAMLRSSNRSTVSRSRA